MASSRIIKRPLSTGSGLHLLPVLKRADHGSAGTSASDTNTDSELVTKTLAGDRRAFGQLVESYQQRVFAIAYRYMGNTADAADLTQRVFLKAFQQLDRLTSPDRFGPWVFRIATNEAKNRLRFHSNKDFQDIEDANLADLDNPEMTVVHRSQRDLLRRALSKLPDRQRQCVLLRIDADLSFREIGEVIGCSEASARVNFHHALKGLKNRLSPTGTGEHHE